MKDALISQPIKLQEYTCKQSKHDVVPKLPLRMILFAPSGAGKNVLLYNLILNVHRDCICSPSVHVGQTWQAVKHYQEQVVKVKETDKEQV
jgi:hypothetical protein